MDECAIPFSSEKEAALGEAAMVDYLSMEIETEVYALYKREFLRYLWLQKISRDQPGWFPLHHEVLVEGFGDNFIDSPITDIDDALKGFDPTYGSATYCVRPKRAKNPKLLRMTVMSWIEASFRGTKESPSAVDTAAFIADRTTVSLWDIQLSENHFKARILHYMQTQQSFIYII